jgi:hypothetical protein
MPTHGQRLQQRLRASRIGAYGSPLSLWRPFEADDEPREEQGYYFSAVLVAAPGYYDTPTQAARRSSPPAPGA